ncbi:MAG TPA: recombinase RecA, partial [Anaerolineales bacterium]
MARKSQQEQAQAQDNGRRAVLDKAVGEIIKRYGDGSIMRLGEAHSMQTEVIPTGSLSLDIALGVGGIPRGRITEIYGPESSGKTTLCQHIVAEAQQMGGTAAFIDMEHALDPVYAARVGVDIDNLLVSQPDMGEQALEITEIYGPESSGKTTLCQHIVAEAQQMGGTAAFIDMEHALDPVYAARVGGDIDNLLVSQPDMGEQALEITETLVRSGAVDVVVIDSVAALVPRSEIEGDMGDPTMGVHARLMSQALRKLSGAINQTKTSVVFTNQLRQKIGVMFGNPETTTGGQALKFYASVRLDVRRIQSIKVGAEIIGNRTRVRVVKNKVAAPFRTAEFDIMYNEGISKVGDLLDLATQFEIVDKRG